MLIRTVEIVIRVVAFLKIVRKAVVFLENVMRAVAFLEIEMRAVAFLKIVRRAVVFLRIVKRAVVFFIEDFLKINSCMEKDIPFEKLSSELQKEDAPKYEYTWCPSCLIKHNYSHMRSDRGQ